MARGEHPKPRTAAPLIAPNMQSQVQQTIDEHPEINTMDDVARGEIIDITDWRVNGGHDRPWGRKARQNDPNNPNLNTDGMTYLRPDGLFEIYDCISGIDGQSSWEGYGPYYQGENGWWWPPQPVEGQIPPVEEKDLEERVSVLEDQVSLLQQNAQTFYHTLLQRIESLEAVVAAGFHAHGPVDLPIVFASLTSLRAKGDIDVQVKPGQATPPPAREGEEKEFSITSIKEFFDKKK